MKLNKESTVGEIMTKAPVTLRSEDILDLADDVMTLGRIRHIPIVEAGRVVGVLSQRDLFRSALAKALGFPYNKRKTLMKAVKIQEVMSSPAITIAASATIKEAGRVMLERKIGCLPVVDGEALTGLVTETDVLRSIVAS